MSDGLHGYLDVASGLARSTLGVTERAVAQFVRQGEVAAEHAERLVDELVSRSVEGSDALAALVRSEVARALERAGVARGDEVEALRARVEELARRVAELEPAAPAGQAAPGEAPPPVVPPAGERP